MALGEERHSGKALFPECNTRGREALVDENWYLTAEVDGATLKTLFPECLILALGELFFFFFSFFAPIFREAAPTLF
jgi:hypothetical protein